LLWWVPARTIVSPGDLAERLAAEAGRRGISPSDLLTEYAEQGLSQARQRRGLAVSVEGTDG